MSQQKAMVGNPAGEPRVIAAFVVLLMASKEEVVDFRISRTFITAKSVESHQW